MTDELAQKRQYWRDVLAAFGARIEIDETWDEGAEEFKYRIRIINQKYVTGPVLVEIWHKRQEVIAAYVGGGSA